MIGTYFRKMAGTTQSPPRVGLAEILWSWLGAFLGIGAVAYINYGWLDGTGLLLLIGSFGASAVLIYGAIKSPLASPATSWAVTSFRPSSGDRLQTSGAPSLAGRGPGGGHQHRGDARHQDPPPAGRRHGPHRGDQRPQVTNLGYLYALMPVAAGAFVMLAVALLVNNLAPRRRYPEFWW